MSFRLIYSRMINIDLTETLSLYFRLSLSSHLKYLQHGDIVEVKVEGIGKIRNKVKFVRFRNTFSNFVILPQIIIANQVSFDCDG